MKNPDKELIRCQQAANAAASTAQLDHIAENFQALKDEHRNLLLCEALPKASKIVIQQNLTQIHWRRDNIDQLLREFDAATQREGFERKFTFQNQ